MTTLFSHKMEVNKTDINSVPRKSLLRSISTFKELDEYITVLTSVLDYVDRFAGHPYFSDYSSDGTFRIYRKNYNNNQYDLRLLYKGIQIICIGYYVLDQSDNIWVKWFDTGHAHIFAYQHEEHENVIDYQGCTDAHVVSLPYRIDDYSESMYDQLEFMYPKEQVNIIMCVSKLDASDSTREHRQFSVYEGHNIDYYKVLQELKDFVYTKTMIQGGFE